MALSPHMIYEEAHMKGDFERRRRPVWAVATASIQRDTTDISRERNLLRSSSFSTAPITTHAVQVN